MLGVVAFNSSERVALTPKPVAVQVLWSLTIIWRKK